VDLVNAALVGFDPHATYELGDDVRTFVTDNYRSMPVLSPTGSDDRPLEDMVRDLLGEVDEHPFERLLEGLDTMLRLGNVVLPELKPLRSGIRERVIKENRYELTADNLRTALGLEASDPVSLERITDGGTGNASAYAYCLENMAGYVAAVDADDRTDHAVTTPDTLTKVLRDLVEKWTEEGVFEWDEGSGVGDLADLLARTSADARLTSVQKAPVITWKALAKANRFRSSLANIEAYRSKVGSIDDGLARLLEETGTVHVDEAEDTTDTDGAEYPRGPAALAILNADEIPPAARVDLVSALAPATPLPIDEIGVEGNELWALLIEQGLVEDDLPTFERLRGGGWRALGSAIKASQNISAFMAPALLTGMVADVLTDADTAVKVGATVVGGIEDYVSDDWAELKAAVNYAYENQVALPPQSVVRIARAAAGAGDVDRPQVLRLLSWAYPDASAGEIVEAFAHLGGDYAKITRTGAKFKVDHDPTHEKLLKVLRAADVATSRATAGKKNYAVTVIS